MRLEGINHRQRDRRRHKSGDQGLQDGLYPRCKYVEVNVINTPGEAHQARQARQAEKETSFAAVNPRCGSRRQERGEWVAVEVETI